MAMVQATSMLRRFILQPWFETIRQAIPRLLGSPVVPRVMKLVGGVALVVSCMLLAYLVGVLLARVVAWGF